MAQARRALDRTRRERRRRDIGMVFGASILTRDPASAPEAATMRFFVTSIPVGLNKGDKMILSDGGIWL
jgi:hypothetical protein